MFRDAAAITAGLAATAGSGFNPLVGTAAGFAAYQALDAVQNVVTTERGGDLRENEHVSLIGLGISAYHGKLDKAALKHAALDATMDGVSAFTNAWGAGLARAASAGVTARITGKFGEKAAEGLLGRAASGAGSALANQVPQSLGALTNTTLTLGSQNKLGTAEGDAVLRTVLRDQAFSTVTNVLGGGIAAAVPAHSLMKQAGVALGQNVIQSELHALVFDGRHMTVKDSIGAFINALPTAAHHLAGHPDRQIGRQPNETRSTPGPKEPGQDHPVPAAAAEAGHRAPAGMGVKATGTEARGTEVRGTEARSVEVRGATSGDTPARPDKYASAEYAASYKRAVGMLRDRIYLDGNPTLEEVNHEVARALDGIPLSDVTHLGSGNPLVIRKGADGTVRSEIKGYWTFKPDGLVRFRDSPLKAEAEAGPPAEAILHGIAPVPESEEDGRRRRSRASSTAWCMNKA